MATIQAIPSSSSWIARRIKFNSVLFIVFQIASLWLRVSLHRFLIKCESTTNFEIEFTREHVCEMEKVGKKRIAMELRSKSSVKIGKLFNNLHVRIPLLTLLCSDGVSSQVIQLRFGGACVRVLLISKWCAANERTSEREIRTNAVRMVFIWCSNKSPVIVQFWNFIRFQCFGFDAGATCPPLLLHCQSIETK